MFMKKSMLDYVKIVLSKVSFDRRLFRKEYRKSLSWLSHNEINELRSWLRQQRYAGNLVVVRAKNSKGQTL
jgi:hypothetical protein